MTAANPSAQATRTVWAIVVMGLPVCAGCDRAPERETVVVYCSADQQIAEKVLAAFEAATGIRVAARFDTEATKTVGLVQRLRAERAKPLADVFWSSEVFHTIRLAREGVFAPYDAEAVRDWPAGLRDQDRRWYGFALRARVIAYNTARVPADQAPKSLEDCLDAKWKGRLAMASPAFGTTGGDVASWFAHYGPERAVEILRALAANGVRMESGNSSAVRAVADGRADVCFTDTDDVHAARRNGWPVAMRPLDQGGDGVLVIPNTVAVVQDGPHPELARKLVAFLLGEAAERILVESDSHNTPVHPELARQFPRYAIGRRLEVDYGRVADFLPRAIAAGAEILR